MDDQQVVTPETSYVDGCPVLNRTQVVVIDQGNTVTVEFVIRDASGKPVDLTRWFPAAAGDSLSLSESEAAGDYEVAVRFAEVLVDRRGQPVWEVAATVTDPANGKVQVTPPKEVTDVPGVYRMSFGVRRLRDGGIVASDQGLLSVEHSLFGDPIFQQWRSLGPPTIQELRMYMRDSSAAENLTLSGVEFGTEQIVDALVAPVRFWNEARPPGHCYDTRTFPYRGAWLDATAGRLFITASHGYRRDHLPYTAGGVSIDDKNKEQPYAAAGQRLWDEYKTFVLNTKTSHNLQQIWGQQTSPYSW